MRKESTLVACACGCGGFVRSPDAWGREHRFCPNHHRKRPLPPARPCACGCGGLVEPGYRNYRYVVGHAGRGRKYPERQVPLVERFWRVIVKGDGCWSTTKKPAASGYVFLRVSRNPELHAPIHRLSWTIHFGPIPEGMFVCHKCDNRACGRPDHLFLGDAKTNAEDRDRKGRWAGPTRGFSRLSPDHVRELRRLSSEGIVVPKLAERFKVSQSTVKRAIHRTTYKDVA